MLDLKKVIEGITICTHQDKFSCKQCPYLGVYGCRAQVMKDALAFLKKLDLKQPAQLEPVKPMFSRSIGFYTCGSCGKTLVGWSDVNYCQKCGRKVKWE